MVESGAVDHAPAGDTVCAVAHRRGVVVAVVVVVGILTYYGVRNRRL